MTDPSHSPKSTFATYVERYLSKQTPVPFGKKICGWLESHRSSFGPILPNAKRENKFVVFDFSIDGNDAMSGSSNRSVEDDSKSIFDKIDRHSADFGIGLYNEPRGCYVGEQFDTGDSRRTIHIGLDLFDRAGQPVLAPLAGVVHSVKDNALPYDYGPTVILKHESEQMPAPFWSLYGHLDRNTLAERYAGEKINQGSVIGRLGSHEENGGWVPHVHFQLILDLMHYKSTGDFPGVASTDFRDVWTSICPDPNLILGLPANLNFAQR